jgi:hypothetical protein
MPEPFEAWFSRFESEFLRYTGTPWSQHQGELEEVLHCHTSGLSPEAAALDLFSASQPAPANLLRCPTASLSPPTKPPPTTR